MITPAPSGGASRHKCLVYDGDPAEQLPVVVPLLAEALADGCRCLYLGDPHMAGLVATAMKVRGVDVEKEIGRGALVFSSERSHLEGGFDPRAMVGMLRSLVEGALRDGFPGGLCATGDMRWELGPDQNFARLAEYEALLERAFRDMPLRGICQYHRRMVPLPALRDALLTHRSLHVGDVLNQDNLFYLPPEAHLDAAGQKDRGDWMCRQILRVMEAERQRDEALAALQESEAQRRRLAEEAVRSGKDLERRVRERTAELEAANREMESFSYSVSHDLKAPLRGIDGFSQAVMEDDGKDLSPESLRNLERVRSAARRMGDLIDDMLALSRLAGRVPVMSPVNVSALAADAAEELRRQAPRRAVTLDIQPGMRATGDPVLLRAALGNLLGNAWKFTAKSPEARIKAGKMEDGSFYVRDNGAGFDMAHADKLFNPFQRLHAQEDFPGTGVGLSTVRRIISRHGGRVWAESTPGQGATFHFTLPA